MTKIRRVLKYLSALLLIAGRPSFLMASGKDVVVIDFKAKEITQEGLQEGLCQYKTRYMERCKKLAEAFNQGNNDKNLRLDDNLDGDFVRNYVEPFHKWAIGICAI